ncbi:MAG TPA: FeoB-associated Cys-rich membrane protein [Candidatus Limiplasma sp.]|nr:FeoB-associated Cys-rich membrane protein [Candidatus Limiplasma sp.]
MVTWIVGGIVVVIAGGIIWKMISDHRHGKHSCGGNCQNCHMSCASRTK